MVIHLISHSLLFAGNPYFISLDEFVKCGYLKEAKIPEADINSDYVDYSYLYENRYALLKKAYENSHITDNEDFKAYCKDNAWWLEDYALFMAIKRPMIIGGWENWPLELRLREMMRPLPKNVMNSVMILITISSYSTMYGNNGMH